MFFESSLFVGLIIGYFMYEDAKNRKLENPMTWFWVGLLFGIFGLATYWYWHIRSKDEVVVATAVKKPAVRKSKAKK